MSQTNPETDTGFLGCLEILSDLITSFYAIKHVKVFSQFSHTNIFPKSDKYTRRIMDITQLMSSVVKGLGARLSRYSGLAMRTAAM